MNRMRLGMTGREQAVVARQQRFDGDLANGIRKGSAAVDLPHCGHRPSP